MLWQECMNVKIIKTHPQYIYMRVSYKEEREWMLSVVYGSPNPSLRRTLWKDLNKNLIDLSEHWMIVGDFNSVTTAEEVSHGGRFDNRRCTGFLNWIYEQELINLGFTGPFFTWTRGTSTFSFKGARLGRALCNPEWRFTFERATITHLPKLNSDHSLLLIKPWGMRDAIPKPFFRF